MTNVFAALWHRWRDARSYGSFIALTALVLLLCVLVGDVLGALVGAASGSVSSGLDDGAAVGGVVGVLLVVFAPTGRGDRRRREAIFGPFRPVVPPTLVPHEQGPEVTRTSEHCSAHDLAAALRSAGFVEQAGALVGGVSVQVFIKSRFRVAWVATRMHVFAFVVDALSPPEEQVPQLAESCREQAISRKRGLPRGLQTGVAAMPFLTVSTATSELAAWASSAQSFRFAAILYPVIVAKDTGTVLRRTRPQRLGRIYEGYLSETAAQIVATS